MSVAVLGWILVQLVCLSVASSIETSSRTILDVPTTTTSPPGYIHYPSINAAFKIHHERRNWRDAKQACISEGARLAVVDTLEKVQYVKANKPRFTDAWVGIARDSSHWVAADDSNLEFKYDFRKYRGEN